MSGYSFYQTLPFADRKYETTPKITKTSVFNLAKDGRKVTLIPAHKASDVPQGLLEVAVAELNYVIDEGQTYPHHQRMDFDVAVSYFFEGFLAILVDGEYSEEMFSEPKAFWEKKYLGQFYVKPNYIGRCSHVCNGGFIVSHKIRGLGLGKEMGKKYLEWAPQLGYVYSVFNLVFESNVASAKIWDSLGFERIGYVKNVAVLKGQDNFVGAIMFGKDLV